MLGKYADEGVTNIEDINVLKVTPIDRFGTPIEIISTFGGKEKYLAAIRELKEQLYQVA